MTDRLLDPAKSMEAWTLVALERKNRIERGKQNRLPFDRRRYFGVLHSSSSSLISEQEEHRQSPPQAGHSIIPFVPSNCMEIVGIYVG